MNLPTVFSLRTTTIMCWLALGGLVCLGHQPMSAVDASSKVVIVLSQESPPSVDMVKGFRAFLTSTGVQLEVARI
jgi:hypothetical protein